MNLKKILAGTLFLSSMLVAGGDIAPDEAMCEEVPAESAWEYSASVYMWLASISGETAAEGDVDVPFSDILDNLDMTFMGMFRAEKEQWGLEADVIYLNVGSSIDDNVLINDFSLKTWIVTPMLTYKIVDADGLNLNILAGGRYLYMQPSITGVLGVERGTSGNLWDGVVGLKGTYDINENWFMPFHFDIGTGDTDMTWQAFAGVGYKYENFDVIAGYRHLEWNFEDGQPGGEVLNDLAIDGPMIGVKFRF